jgi:hypothetical protein
MAEDHQRVVQIADDARELELENGIETGYDFLGIDLVVFTGHDVLPVAGSLLKNTPSGGTLGSYADATIGPLSTVG